MTHVSPAPETYWAVPQSCAYCRPCSTCPITNTVTAVTSQFTLLPPRPTSCPSTFSQQPPACQQAVGIQESTQGTVYPKGSPSNSMSASTRYTGAIQGTVYPKGVLPPEGSGECLQALLRGPPPIFKPTGQQPADFTAQSSMLEA